MNTRDKIFENYKRLRGDFLDTNISDVEKQKFFDNFVIYRYMPYISHFAKNAKILEIGCNKGYLLKAMRDYGFKNLVGIDLSPEDVQLAKNRTGIKEIFVADVFEYLEDKKDTFDIIISKDVLEHIPKDKQELFVQCIYKSLKKNGVTIIQVPNMDWIFANHERYMDFTHEIGYTRESLGDIFRLYFDEVKVMPASYIFTDNIKRKIIYGIGRPILIKLVKFLLKFLGEGAADVWFEHREIMVIARKK